MSVCEHFGVCGGCRFQDIPYSKQVQAKEENIRQLACAHGFADVTLRPTRSFDEWHYRNKMEFTFSAKDGGVVCGLHEKGRRRSVFHVNECRIFSPDIGIILAAIRDFAQDRGYPAYDAFSYQGFLRHCIVREAKTTGEIMVGLVTTSKQDLDSEAFIKTMLSLILRSKIQSIYWIVNDSKGDAVTFQEKKLIYGEPCISEELGGFIFKISIDSFFQVNSRAIPYLYNTIVSSISWSGTENVLDLYCGMGSIGLFLAKQARFVWGIEVQDLAVRAAAANAENNGVKNISFIASDVRKFLAQRDFRGQIDLIVANPPRCGLSPKVKAKILDVGPRYFMYSSCNPQTFFADLEYFSKDYALDWAEPFDFFPHTPHVEVLGFLTRTSPGHDTE